MRYLIIAVVFALGCEAVIVPDTKPVYKDTVYYELSYDQIAAARALYESQGKVYPSALRTIAGRVWVTVMSGDTINKYGFATMSQDTAGMAAGGPGRESMITDEGVKDWILKYVVNDLMGAVALVDAVDSISGTYNNGDLIFTRGLNTPGDGAGSTYRVQPDSVDLHPIDGIGVIDLGGNYAVLQPVNGVIDVRQFGGKPNDVVSDSAAMEMADTFAYRQNYALQLGGGGTYRFDGVTTSVRRIIGGGSTIIPHNEVFEYVLLAQDSIKSISGLTIDARGKGSGATAGLSHIIMTRSTMEPVTIKDVTIYGANEFPSGGAYQEVAVKVSTMGDQLIDNVHVRGIQYAGFNPNVTHRNSVKIVNSSCKDYRQNWITVSGEVNTFENSPTTADRKALLSFPVKVGSDLLINPENISGTGNIHNKYQVVDLEVSGSNYEVTLDRVLDANYAGERVAVTGGSLILDNVTAQREEVLSDTYGSGQDIHANGGVIDPINIIISEVVLTNCHFLGYGYLGVGLKIDYFKDLKISDTEIENNDYLDLGAEVASTRFALNLANTLDIDQNVRITNSKLGGYTLVNTTDLVVMNSEFDLNGPYQTNQIGNDNPGGRMTFTNCIFRDPKTYVFEAVELDSMQISLVDCKVVLSDTLDAVADPAIFRTKPAVPGDYFVKRLTKHPITKMYWAANDLDAEFINYGDENHSTVNFARYNAGGLRVFRGNQTGGPTGGPYRKGDIYLRDQYFRGGTTGSYSGRDFMYICTAAGSPGTWAPIGVNEFLADVVFDEDLTLDGIPEYADEAAAVTGGLESGKLYKTATGEIRIKL